MSDIPSGETVEKTVSAVTELVKAVPVYQDTLQPAMKETGGNLLTVAKVVTAVFLPLRILIKGTETLEDVFDRVTEKLKAVPPDRILPPAPNIAGPALQAVVFTEKQDPMREMYASLLASAMNDARVEAAHPAFVDIIRNLSADEAQIMSLFSAGTRWAPVEAFEKLKLRYPSSRSAYIDNLMRLGVLADTRSETSGGMVVGAHWTSGGTVMRGPLRELALSDLGIRFCEACVLPPDVVMKPDETRLGHIAESEGMKGLF